MALPIRLVVGPDNLMEISLEAQAIDIVVDRNASAFPTPDNIVGRVAIDTNIPTIGIEIDGIFQDDDSVTMDVDAITSRFSGGDVGFNFASVIPTTNFANEPTLINNYGGEYANAINYLKFNFKPTDLPTIQNSVTSFINIYDTPDTDNDDIFVDTIYNSPHDSVARSIRVDLAYGGGGARLFGGTVNHTSVGATYSAGSTTIRVANNSEFQVKQRVHKVDGTFVGTVTSISGTFSGGTKVDLADDLQLYSFRATVYTSQGQIVGSIVDSTTYTGRGWDQIASIKLDNLSVPVYAGLNYYITTGATPPIEALLHNKQFVLYPNYWRIDGMTTSRTLPLGVHFVFSNDMAHADYQNQTSGGVQIAGTYPYVTNTGTHFKETDDAGKRIPGTGNDVYVRLPIGGISTHAVNGNPASTLALIVKKALELTTNVITESNGVRQGYITSTGGQTIASAFTVLVSGPTLKAIQKDGPIDTPFGIISTSLDPCIQYDASDEVEISDAGIYDSAKIQYFTEPYVISQVSVNSKSAGDKVQDLLGLVSNAKKDTDLIRGLQIPYDSLIQSSAVTPVARNFFLTFGEQTNDAKGSIGNTIPASHKMLPGLLPKGLGGDPKPDNDDDWFDKFGLATDLVNTVGPIAEFAGTFVRDIFLTLSSDPHGNEGGMRIIPEKLHVRYDAGNKYYAYKLRLLASDFVIGV